MPATSYSASILPKPLPGSPTTASPAFVARLAARLVQNTFNKAVHHFLRAVWRALSPAPDFACAPRSWETVPGREMAGVEEFLRTQ
jgi:hypothetical protein